VSYQPAKAHNYSPAVSQLCHLPPGRIEQYGERDDLESESGSGDDDDDDLDTELLDDQDSLLQDDMDTAGNNNDMGL